MADGNYVNVRVSTPDGGALYFIQPYSDTATGRCIYRTAGDALQFHGGGAGYVFKSSGDTTLVTISNSGQTTMKSSDATPLVLDAGAAGTQYGANIRFRRNDGQATWALGAGVGGGTQQDFGLVDVLANNTVRFFVDAAGNVGLGTTTPKSKLDAAGTIRATAQTDPSSGDGVEILYTGTEGHVIAYSRPASGYKPLHLDGTTLLLNANSGSNVSIGTINNGNVGIGTTSPAQRLTVESPSTSPDTNIAAFSYNGHSVGVGIGYQEIRQIYAGQSMRVNAATNGMVHLGNVSTGGVSLATAGGNVGVGTTSPLAKLHVAGTVVADGNVGFGISTLSPQAPLQVGPASVFSAGQIRIGANNAVSAREWDIGPRSGVTPPLSFVITDWSQLDHPARLVIKADSSGNVGIGVTDPQDRLHVGGAMRADGAISTTGQQDIMAGGDVRAGKKLIANSRTIADEAGKVFGAVYG